MSGGQNKQRPTVRTIPAGRPFTDSLAAGIMERAGDAPEALPGFIVLLPTRRACRALREAFLRWSDGTPLLLPRMFPLGDLDEQEPPAGAESSLEKGLDLPPAIPSLRRRLLLAQLVMAVDGWQMMPSRAVALAGELSRFLDQVHTERLDFERLTDLAPENFAEHWQITLDFLHILFKSWPQVLAEEGGLDPAQHRNFALEARARAWEAAPPSGPVIAAGSTGSIPATADLLSVIARLPRGTLVLPGLDTDMDDKTWEILEPSHPQYGMAQLLKRLDVPRSDVGLWRAPDAGGADPSRFALIAEATRAAETTHLWTQAPSPPDTALAGVSRADCPTPREEAALIALALRETLEEPGRRAALVTADRNLARRVAGELGRWGIDVDDSAGRPLAEEPPGAFLRLTAEAAVCEMAPIPLLAMLKHPLAAGGIAPAAFRSKVRRLEMAALHGPRPEAGLIGLIRTLGESDREENASDLHRWLARLDEIARPLTRLLDQEHTTLPELLSAHVAFTEALAASDTADGPARLWAGEAGEATANFISEFQEATVGFPHIKGRDYPALLEALIAERVTRPHFGLHPRLAIWGLLEARLQHVDRLILGGLNEGCWPPEAHLGPWMSRPMRQAFGLPLPERRIGLSAHDFVQAFCAPEVLLTRSQRVDGNPSLPSRWLVRLDNLLEGKGLHLPSAAHYLDWAERLDKPDRQTPITRPLPRPPAAARPMTLSVTQVQTWIRDPYVLYAQQILGLRPLDPLEADPSAADRGIIIHKALDLFIKAFPGDLPADAEKKLISIGREVFGQALAHPGVRAFWWPRFKRIAYWFIAHEQERRAMGEVVAITEARGRLDIPIDGALFQLTARVDRIDRLPDGGLAILDYKTGKIPSWKDMESGLAPQLPLEAAIAEKGCFEGLAICPIEKLVYLQVSGGRNPGKRGEYPEDAMSLVRAAQDGLERRVKAFMNPHTPYLPKVRFEFAGRMSPYDHLSRIAEWSAGGGEGDQ